MKRFTLSDTFGASDVTNATRRVSAALAKLPGDPLGCRRGLAIEFGSHLGPGGLIVDVVPPALYFDMDTGLMDRLRSLPGIAGAVVR